MGAQAPCARGAAIDSIILCLNVYVAAGLQNKNLDSSGELRIKRNSSSCPEATTASLGIHAYLFMHVYLCM